MSNASLLKKFLIRNTIHMYLTSVNSKKEIVRNDPSQNDPPTFLIDELAAATNNFRDDCILEKGRLGTVYKGRLKSTSQDVVIRRLNYSRQGRGEFLAHVNLLSKLHHPNLVDFIGFCVEDGRLLVYEYLPLGSLEAHLFRYNSNLKPLDWKTRMKIASCVAYGLKYLHAQDPPVTHEGLKCSNILLGEEYHAKLSNFGLREVMIIDAQLEIRYAVADASGVESDICCFGVLLLEIITGRRAVDESSRAEVRNLVDWAQPFFNDDDSVTQMADFSLEGKYPESGFKQAVLISSMCLRTDPSARPQIDEIITGLASTCVENNQIIDVADEISVDSKKEIVSSQSQHPQTFLLADLAAATNNFSDDFYLGQVRLGSVYRGQLKSTCQDIIIKRLNYENHQGFLDYVGLLSKLHHPSLADFLGFCDDGDGFLVYEYMPLESLEAHLFGYNPNNKPLDWNTRMKIALCAGNGLKYLHAQDPPVMHGYLRCSNIFLGGEYHAKLAEFGLYILLKNCGQTEIEDDEESKVGVDHDIQWFGLLLLQLITGKRAVEHSEADLVAWAQPYLDNDDNIWKIADLSLENHFPGIGFKLVAAVAADCLREDPTGRPQMDEIVNSLTFTGDLE